MEPNFVYPILYTSRRCPYAMRARFAIRSSKINVEVREIKLQEKPSEFLKSSPKGTVQYCYEIRSSFRRKFGHNQLGLKY